ncbi:hypothetical protein RDWZM_005615 [Blomia tropicalis]|uniref:Uncharacterized protein n=1 Tax=Blomia tropicalis TaxID=40697 RepID=A0A9Q0RL07_BLOTA|nr:hypothetical protein RDWZM_005615 [Blomia tropicalis]
MTGAILENGDEQLLETLRRSLDQINQNRIVLPRTKLNITAYMVDPNDSFNAAKLACKLLDEKVWALFSPRSEIITWYVRSLANEMQIPHLTVSWNYRSKYLYNMNINPEDEGDKTLNHEQSNQIGGVTSLMPNGEANLQWLGTVYGTSSLNNRTNRERFRQIGNSIVTYPSVQQFPIEHDYTVNLFPDSNQLSEAFKDFVLARNWKSFTMIYDNNDGLIMLKDLLRISSEMKRRRIKITVIEFPELPKLPPTSVNVNLNPFQEYDRDQFIRTQNVQTDFYQYRKLLKDIKKTEHNIVLSLSQERAINFLRQALETKRMSEYDNYLIATLDIHRFDLSEFQYKTLANITGFSLLSATGQDDFGMMTNNRNRYYDPFYGESKLHQVTTTEALIHDAISVYARSLDDLDRSLGPDEIVEPFISCDRTNKWPFGSHLMKMNGITGHIAFDSHGHRVNFTLDIMQLKQNGLKNVAKWSKDGGVTSNANYTFYDSYKQILEAMKYKELRITIPPNSRPYIYLKDNHEEFTGNDKFEGFCVDLLIKITEVFQKKFQSDFKYQIKIVTDMQYGQPNKETGEWNGIVGELLRHQADLAIGDLTATYLRETAVDFTMPFMNLGIAILFKKTAIPDPELFSFLKPLSVEVWLYLASAFLGISILFWILSRISPYEWVSPHSCDPDPLELENQFSIGNSLWFTIGSLMQQGSDLAPRAWSTRLLASIWWFFTLIMISSYTANLAASLTLSRMAPAISNVEDLAKQTAIQYGCRPGGSTHDFFRNSNHTTYQRMFNTMESNQEVYIKKLEDAIERVRKGGYAYLAESSTIDYLVERQCDLYQVGTWLDNKGYGIATPPDSPYRTPISNAIVVLQDEGQLYELKKRWWVDYGGGLCADDAKISAAMELNIENVGGVFVVLVSGVVMGCLFGIIEFIWKSLKIARDERESIGKLMWFEVVRICTGGSSSRPLNPAQSSSNNLNNASGTNGTPVNEQLQMNGSGLTKAPSFTSMSGQLSPSDRTVNVANSPSSYDYNPRYNNGIMSPQPPPPPHPFHQRQQPSYSSYDGSTAPLLSPSTNSNHSKSLSRVNSNPNSGLKSPSSYSTMY